MIGESCPTLHADGPVARPCAWAGTVGVAVEVGSTCTAVCACGHPMAAASVESLQESFRAHIAYRVAQ